MNATELTIVRPRLLVTDDTEYYNFADDANWIKRIENVYLYDESQITHCCELAGSHWCEPLYTCIEFADGIDDDLRDELEQKYAYENHDGCYVHAGRVDRHGKVVILEDEAFEDYEYDDAFDEVVDYYRYNWFYG